MGNSQSLDYNATNYILSMNHQNLRKLHDKSYCNKITGLSSILIAKYFKDKNIHYLLNRIKYGEAELMDTSEKNINAEDKIQICNNISVFYVKIAHIYAAIMIALNPKYIFTDKHGQQIIVDLHDKHKIPKNIIPEIYYMGFCNNLYSILNVKDLNDTPKFCNMNKTIYICRNH